MGYLSITPVACVFVLAEVVCGAGPVPYASVGNTEVLQKFHSKKLGTIQGLACERKLRFCEPIGGVFWCEI